MPTARKHIRHEQPALSRWNAAMLSAQHYPFAHKRQLRMRHRRLVGRNRTPAEAAAERGGAGCPVDKVRPWKPALSRLTAATSGQKRRYDIGGWWDGIRINRKHTLAVSEGQRCQPSTQNYGWATRVGGARVKRCFAVLVGCVKLRCVSRVAAQPACFPSCGRQVGPPTGRPKSSRIGLAIRNELV